MTEMQKRGSEVLVEVDGKPETNFFAAQRFKSVFYLSLGHLQFHTLIYIYLIDLQTILFKNLIILFSLYCSTFCKCALDSYNYIVGLVITIAEQEMLGPVRQAK